MNKYTVLAILLAIFLMVPLVAKADTLDDQIADIQAQVVVITAQLNQLLLMEQSEAQNFSFCEELRQDINLNNPDVDSSVNVAVNNNLANLSVCGFGQ